MYEDVFGILALYFVTKPTSGFLVSLHTQDKTRYNSVLHALFTCTPKANPR